MNPNVDMSGIGLIANDAALLRPLVIFGAGGHALSVANVALSAGYSIKFFVDKEKEGLTLLDYKIVGHIGILENIERFSFALAVGDNAVRESMYEDLINEFPNLYFPPLVHSSAVVSFFTSIGAGTVVMPKAVIGPNSKVGNFCLINTQASIDHDCTMLNYSSLAPGAVTGGGVLIGLRSVVSLGAKIKHGIRVGDDSIVGANSYLNKDLPNNQVAYGIPAKQVRARNLGDPYLK
jgi:sugar O-acyltransferase (sialic acid O-acetyltransferase NeuD family)